MSKQHGPSDIFVQVTGKRPESVINDSLREELILKNITKSSAQTIECFITSADLPRLEQIAADHDCSVEVIRISLLEKCAILMKKRAGFVAGILLFTAALILLSQMVWKVEIEGAQPVLQHEIEKNLTDMGVSKGAFAFLLPSPEQIQKEILERTDGTTWIGVEKRGTTYHFEVVEQTLPEEAEVPPPRHITANKTAVIHSIYAEQGQVLVDRNQLVHEGDILISGFIGKGKHARTVAAKGEVLGETWYKVTVDIPVKPKADTLTGRSERKYILDIFGFELPLWGMDADEAFDIFKKTKNTHDAAVFGYTLPIAWNVETYQESRLVNQAGSKNDVIKQAKKAAENKIKSQLTGKADIKEGKILHEESHNGKVKIVLHYQVIEEITSEVPIIQGE
ncbi:similar to stage IV sporulation protein [Alteribacillus persepolensis]|uniref:Similar to stage IV sporulation protein n=1 Tax=Alteribacillus persepolensis TaxID=568899 RepID=A0A1G8CRB7_9BACI|nr:sporulation protein YqfD [Alteribacillus persepolensis]SDH47729.1 similar to stage IV sporulation protein [Alteribacillus persepolensis]